MSNLEIKTPLLRQADQYTIGGYEQAALADFAMHVMNLYSEFKNQDSVLYTVGLYKSFENRNCKTIYINPKNINYTSTITDTRTQLSQLAIVYKADCGLQNELLKEGYNYFQDIPNWEDLFGKGEFPQLVIRAFRLGNSEYFCYSITR